MITMAGVLEHFKYIRSRTAGNQNHGERARPGCCFCQAEVRPPSRKTRARRNISSVRAISARPTAEREARSATPGAGVPPCFNRIEHDSHFLLANKIKTSLS